MLIRGNPDILKPPSNPLGYSGLDAVPRELFAMNTVEDQVQFFANEFPWYPTTAVRYYLNTYGPDDFGGPMWGYLLGHVQNLIDTETALLEGNKRSLAAAQAEPSGAAGDPALWAFAVQQGQAKLDQLLRDKAKVVDYQAQWQAANATEQEAARARVDAYWEDQRAQAAAREAQRQAEAAAFAAAEEIRYAQAQAEAQARLTEQIMQESAKDVFVEPVVLPEPQLVRFLPKDLDKIGIYEQARIYNMLIDAGNSDGQVRDAVEYVYGAQADENWQLLQRAADDLRRPVTKLPIELERDFIPGAPGAEPLPMPTPMPIPGEPDFTMPVFPDRRDIFEPPTLPYNLTELTLVQKRQVYADLRKEGYTDAEIRTAVENQVGKQSDADWALVSAPSRVVPVVDTGRVDDTGRVEPPAAGGGIAPLLLAVAAAAILGA